MGLKASKIPTQEVAFKNTQKPGGGSGGGGGGGEASKNPRAQEAAFKNTQKPGGGGGGEASKNPKAQEVAFEDAQKPGGREGRRGTNKKPVQEKEATAKKGFSNPPPVLLFDQGMQQYQLLWLPAGSMLIGSVSQGNGALIGSMVGGWLIHYGKFVREKDIVPGYEDQVLLHNCIFLLNPLSGVKLSLPPEPRFVTRQTFKRQFVAEVLTSNCSPDSPEFFVVAFFLNCGVYWLAFCRYGDESWTHITDIKRIGENRNENILIHPALALDDKSKLLYFVHLNPSASNYDLLVFDLKDSNNIKKKRLVMAESNLPREGIFSRVIKRDTEDVITNSNFGDRRLYLVADSSCGDLFMVLQKNDVDDSKYSSNILPVKSYRVFIKVDEGGPQWKEIHDLGDRSIFISHNGSSRLVSTAELNVNSKSEKEIFRENCIYFALQCSKITLRRDIGVFSLADRSTKHCDLPLLFRKYPIVTLWFFNPGST